MRSVNSARERLKPVVLMLATLLAMTSRFCSWALMPVAAIASALISSSSVPLVKLSLAGLGVALMPPSDCHTGDLLVGRDRLVADREDRLERTLRLHNCFDDPHRRRRAF